MTEICLDEGLRSCFGVFDKITVSGDKLEIVGWMLSPDTPFDSFILFINNNFVCPMEVIERADVAKAFKRAPHATSTGFNKTINLDIDTDQLFKISVVACLSGKQLAKIQTCYSKKVAESITKRSTHLIKRVTGRDDHDYFGAISFRSYGDYWELIEKHMKGKEIKTLLDWGCGCARITSMFRALTNIPEIHGCDIDKEAIDWCRSNLKGIEFTSIPLSPPTKYPDGYFDVIFANSVLTHLTKQLQIAWLCEMKRILKPQGLILASVHGQAATYLCFPDKIKEISDMGIFDNTRGGLLKGVAPDDYYRETFQSKEYTINTYSKYFEILDYVEQGSLSYQDIVVMKKVDSNIVFKADNDIKRSSIKDSLLKWVKSF